MVRLLMQNLINFDNALNLIDKIREGKISLIDVKNNQAKFKSNLGEIKKAHKSRSKKPLK